jgi:hypothetical protein
MITWRKSSYSATSGDCVELTHATDLFGIRDSKNTDGPELRLAGRHGLAFLGAIKSGRVVQR